MKLVIPRATPGTGKSTYVKKTYPGAVVGSADHFFDKLGRFEPRFLGKAHGECSTKVETAMKDKAPLIVVDNTNIKVRDFMPYVNMARKYGYEVEIVRLECDPLVAWERCVHKVPKETCLKMARELAESVLPEGCPPEIVIKTG